MFHFAGCLHFVAPDTHGGPYTTKEARVMWAGLGSRSCTPIRIPQTMSWWLMVRTAYVAGFRSTHGQADKGSGRNSGHQGWPQGKNAWLQAGSMVLSPTHHGQSFRGDLLLARGRVYPASVRTGATSAPMSTSGAAKNRLWGAIVEPDSTMSERVGTCAPGTHDG